MNRLTRTLLMSLVASLALGAAHAAREYALVDQGQARARIVLGAQASWQDQFAARELQRHVKEMTGTALPIQRVATGASSRDLLILLGRPETHEWIQRLAAAGSLALDPADLTPEGFVIKTTTWQGQPCLVLAGVTDVGTVYAAYDLLERFGRVGFFRYEEHIPKRRSFAVPECDLRERPYFRVRPHGGQYHYFGIHFFSEKQWEEDLQWYAKYRLNQQNYPPGPNAHSQVDALLWQRLGIGEAQPQTPRERTPGEALAMLKRLARYGAQLGIRAPLYTTEGQIPREMVQRFQEKYPEVRCLSVPGSLGADVYVHPADPMWLRLNQLRLETYIEAFGDSRVYYLPAPPAERSPGDTPEEKEEYARAYAEAVGKLAKWAEAEHPGALWVLDGWAFANRSYWQPYRVERLLKSLPERLNLVILDYPAEEEAGYHYNNYWFGRPWAFMAFNSMNANSAAHGDVHSLMGKVFRVLCDQRAQQMIGFGYYTEARDYAPFYKDLACHLAWNPFRRLEEFLVDYCERRYEPESVPAMVACHQKLLQTVYGPQSDTHLTDGFRTCLLQNPVYWYELGGNWVPFDDLQGRVVAQRRHWAPLLREALAEALSAGAREKDNVAYRRDLADLMRSYVHARINEDIWEAAEAARAGDRVEFEKRQARIGRLFDYLLLAINTVSDRWEFGVAALVKDFEDAPLHFTPEEIRHHLYYVTFGGDRIYDYARSDRYEMIRDIYRPMTEAYLQACGALLAEGGRGLPSDEVRSRLQEEVYRPAVEALIKGPCPPPLDPPDAVAAAKRFLEAVRKGEI